MFWRRDSHTKTHKLSRHAFTRALDLVGIYEEEIEEEDRRRYTLTLPHEYVDGASVNVLLSGTEDVLQIEKLPEGLEPGSSISLIVSSSLHEWDIEKRQDNAVTSAALERDVAFLRLNLFTDIFWMAISAALVCFTTTSFAVATFASMEISGGCLAENPKNSALLISKMYFLLFKGLCSSPSGANKGEDFCILWSDYDIWRNIDAVVRSEEKMYTSAKIAWPVAQVMSVLAFLFFFCTLICQILALVKPRSLFTTVSRYLYIALCYILFAFICSLVTILEVEFSATMKETLWETFFDRSTFSNALLGDATINLRTNASDPCVVLTGYRTVSEGMLFIVLAVPLSFFLFWWTLGLKVIKPVEL